MAKRLRSKLKSESKKIAKAIAKLFKEEVIRQDLIDTGLMKDSFRVTISLGRKGELEIFVSAVDYFQYIDGSPHFFKVSEAVYASKKYKQLEDRLIGLMSVEFLINLPNDFDTSDAVTYNFTFTGFE